MKAHPWKPFPAGHVPKTQPHLCGCNGVIYSRRTIPARLRERGLHSTNCGSWINQVDEAFCSPQGRSELSRNSGHIWRCFGETLMYTRPTLTSRLSKSFNSGSNSSLHCFSERPPPPHAHSLSRWVGEQILPPPTADSRYRNRRYFLLSDLCWSCPDCRKHFERDVSLLSVISRTCLNR